MLTIEKLFAHSLEGFLVAGASLSLFGIRLKYKKLLLIAFIYGLLVFGVRQFYIINEIPFGTHSFMIFGSTIFILRFFGNQDYIVSILAVLVSYLLILWGESVFAIPIMSTFFEDTNMLEPKLGHYTLGMLLSSLFLIVVFIICYVFQKTIIDLKLFSKTNENRG